MSFLKVTVWNKNFNFFSLPFARLKEATFLQRATEIIELVWMRLCIRYYFDTMVIFEQSVFGWCR